jgi:hypothetical protein
MWYIVTGSGNWPAAIDNSQSSTQGGFTDWFIGNINQVSTIVNISISSPLNYSPFNINTATAGTRIWTSSTNPSTTTEAFNVRTISAGISYLFSEPKTGVRSYILCRQFIPSDFGL